MADIDEFCGKIKAGKDSQSDENFCIVARVEAFIAGWDVKEALRRAEAYRIAGADAVLIHSKKNNPSDIELFMKEWGNRCPVVIVPTKFYSTPTDRFRELGISLIIWANHLMRGAIKYMKEIGKNIYTNESLIGVEDNIVSVSEVFRLQGAEELQLAEKKYLPTKGREITSIILAASRGEELGELTSNKPKAMIEINKVPILFSFISTLNNIDIKNVIVVRGFKKEVISGTNFKTIDNLEYESTKDLYSLYLALDYIKGDCIISYGDCLYKKHLVSDLLENESEIKIVVDADINIKKLKFIKNSSISKFKMKDLIKCTKAYSNDFFNNEIFVDQIEASKYLPEANGEWTGLLAVNAKGAEIIKNKIIELSKNENFKQLSITDLIQELTKITKISVVYTKGGWLDIDNIEDFSIAEGF